MYFKRILDYGMNRQQSRMGNLLKIHEKGYYTTCKWAYYWNIES